MCQPHVDDQVRLTGDIPELLLQRGRIGVVRSIWFEPTPHYEVEFEHDSGERYNTLALLEECQLSLDGVPVHAVS